MKFPVFGFAGLVFLTLAGLLGAAPEAERHVVLIVWDGMRPDFVTPELTPNLLKLQDRGVRFAKHHPVYLCSTEVNGTALATGAYPEHSFVIANVDFRPGIDPQKPVAIEDPAVIAKGDAISGGHYLGRPTVAEILQARGLTTVIAGSKPVALLHDRLPHATDGSPVLAEGQTHPVALAAELVKQFGAFPAVAADQNKLARDDWTTQALLHGLWRDTVPAFSLLWLAEPDASQHAAAPGSEQAKTVIRNSDRNLGLVVAELERRGLLDRTDILVVSDHAFSTIGRKVDLVTELSKAGFTATRAALGGLKPGQVLVAGNGGSSLLFVGGHDEAVIGRLAAWLQHQDWTSVIFSKHELPGTFPLAEARIDSPEAPDLVASFSWSGDKSDNGTPGLQVSDLAASSTKRGNHASLSPYDMHNTLVAAGPDFRSGMVDSEPTANLDVAPTILHVLGLAPSPGMDGRVLAEALVEPAAPAASDTHTLTAQRIFPDGRWTQQLQISEKSGVRYLDQGIATFIPATVEKQP